MRRAVFSVVLLLMAVPLLATTVVLVSPKESVRLSELILVGRVARVQSVYDAEGQIVREITLSVDEALKGKTKRGEAFVFRAWGGVKDGVRDEALGEAKYKVGERVLVQLENVDGFYHTLGLAFGKWNVETDKTGKQILRRDLRGLTGVKTEKPAVPLRMELRQMRELVKQVEKERIAR